nr:hypothetical protein BaRGS_007691 [Batillaria attramentaria]
MESNSYFVSPGTFHFDGARKYCFDSHGRLAVLDGEDEFNSVADYLAVAELDGAYKWHNGNEVDELFWARREPKGKQYVGLKTDNNGKFLLFTITDNSNHALCQNISGNPQLD